MKSLEIYLKFKDNCREAFEFYRSSFGGEFAEIQSFADGPSDMRIDAKYNDRVMHVSLQVGSSVLMGCDTVPGFGPPTEFGNNFAVSVQSDTREEADDIFVKLSDGGTVLMPMQDMFWGGYFGALTDRFGVTWNIHYASSDA